MNTRRIGDLGEDLTADYITKLGMKIIMRNYRFGREEIDIIAKDGDATVFIEVKMRRSFSKGRPEDAVTLQKKRSIIYAATGYLKQNNLLSGKIRFDVASICENDIKYIKAAFDATGL